MSELVSRISDHSVFVDRRRRKPTNNMPINAIQKFPSLLYWELFVCTRGVSQQPATPVTVATDPAEPPENNHFPSLTPRSHDPAEPFNLLTPQSVRGDR